MLNILAVELLENHLKGYCSFLQKTAIKIIHNKYEIMTTYTLRKHP
jgi:hypothetical protein